MTNDFTHEAVKEMAALERWLAPIFAKAPHLPPKAREFLAQVAPWLALIFGVLGLLAMLSMGAIGFLLSLSFMDGGLMSISMLVSFIAGLVGAVLQLMAFKPLSARKKKGWNYIFYGMVLSLAASIVNLLIGYGDVVGTIIGTLIGFWLLFEVRSLYR